MTRDEARDRIAFRIGRRSGTSLLNDIVSEMQLVQTRLEQGAELPWFLITQRATITGPTTGNESFALPTSFIRFPEDEGGMWVMNPDSGLEEKLSMRWNLEELVREFGSESADVPQYLTIVGLYGYVRPIPAGDYVYKSVHYARDSVPSGAQTNNWLTYGMDLILEGTVMQMAKAFGDALLYQESERDFNKAMARLVQENVGRAESARDRIIGEED